MQQPMGASTDLQQEGLSLGWGAARAAADRSSAAKVAAAPRKRDEVLVDLPITKENILRPT